MTVGTEVVRSKFGTLIEQQSSTSRHLASKKDTIEFSKTIGSLAFIDVIEHTLVALVGDQEFIEVTFRGLFQKESNHLFETYRPH